MESIGLSSKGQAQTNIQFSYHWNTGLVLILIYTGQGILLKADTLLSESTLSESILLML